MAMTPANLSVKSFKTDGKRELKEVTFYGENFGDDLTVNTTPVPSEPMTLHAWQGSDSYFYVLDETTDDTADGTVFSGWITESGNLALTETTAVYKKEPVGVYKYGNTSHYYESDMEPTYQPAGTKDAGTNIGSIYIAVSTDTHLTTDKWYAKDSEDTPKWHEVSELTPTGIVLGDEITDADAITELEAGTLVAITYYVYTSEEPYMNVDVGSAVPADSYRIDELDIVLES